MNSGNNQQTLFWGQCQYTFKALIQGHSGVGKTQIFNRYLNDDFDKVNYKPTTKAQFAAKFVNHGRHQVQLQLWDCAGAEYFYMQNSMIKNADAFILVFDITNRESFNKIKTLYLENYMISGKMRAREQVNIIVGAKTDLSDTRVVSYEEARELAFELNASYVEVSSAINTNLNAVFDTIMESLIPQDEPEFVQEEEEEKEILEIVPSIKRSLSDTK
jgi:Ras-related protein Rab-1A